MADLSMLLVVPPRLWRGEWRVRRAGDLLGGLLGKQVLCEQWSIRGGENAG